MYIYNIIIIVLVTVTLLHKNLVSDIRLPITKVPSTARESVAVVPVATKQTSEPVCVRGGTETNTVSVFKLFVVFSAFDFTDMFDDKQWLLLLVAGSLRP